MEECREEEDPTGFFVSFFFLIIMYVFLLINYNK